MDKIKIIYKQGIKDDNIIFEIDNIKNNWNFKRYIQYIWRKINKVTFKNKFKVNLKNLKYIYIMKYSEKQIQFLKKEATLDIINKKSFYVKKGNKFIHVNRSNNSKYNKNKFKIKPKYNNNNNKNKFNKGKNNKINKKEIKNILNKTINSIMDNSFISKNNKNKISKIYNNKSNNSSFISRNNNKKQNKGFNNYNKFKKFNYNKKKKFNNNNRNKNQNFQ